MSPARAPNCTVIHPTFARVNDNAGRYIARADLLACGSWRVSTRDNPAGYLTDRAGADAAIVAASVSASLALLGGVS